MIYLFTEILMAIKLVIAVYSTKLLYIYNNDCQSEMVLFSFQWKIIVIILIIQSFVGGQLTGEFIIA